MTHGDLDMVLLAIHREVVRVSAKHPPYHSAHEGYAVIAEEVDEFWELVRKRNHDQAAMTVELVQVAATAIRAIEYCLQGTETARERNVMLGLPADARSTPPECATDPFLSGARQGMREIMDAAQRGSQTPPTPQIRPMYEYED
jgi:hypothetical protein